MQNKVIFIRYLPLTKQVEQEFYFSDILQAGICVEYWDISKLFSFIPENVETYESKLNFKYITFQSYAELRKAIKLNSTALFWSIMTLETRIFKLWILLSRYKCKKIVFANLPIAFGSAVNGDVRYFSPKVLFQGISNVLMRTMIRLNIIKGYEYILMGGSEGWRGIGLIKPDMINKSNIIKVHSIAYNNYLRFKECSPLLTTNYTVFLDQYLPFHPDNLICGLTPPDPKKYYAVINKALDIIEDYYGQPIIIAAHPKAIKYYKHNYFNGRTVLFNVTDNLIIHSDRVLLHNSTALSTAIVARKSLLFIESQHIESVNKDFNDDIRYLAALLKSPCVIAESLTIEDLKKIENDSRTRIFDYEVYKKLYLTSIDNDAILNEITIPKAIHEILA